MHVPTKNSERNNDADEALLSTYYNYGRTAFSTTKTALVANANLQKQLIIEWIRLHAE